MLALAVPAPLFCALMARWSALRKESMSRPRRVRAGQNRPRLYGGRPPATVYAKCFTAILKRLRRLRLLAPAGQVHGTVLLDDCGEAGGGQGAGCGMTSAASRRWMPLPVREGREKWLAHLNNPPAAAWPAFKLAWWREHHPERWPKLAKVLMPKDYINFMLTGALATDYSERPAIS